MNAPEKSVISNAMLPNDEHNQRLLNYVHPPHWVNPTPTGQYNLVVIGGGTAGLVTAAIAAGLGAKVALIERHLMGGDCLNVGCVPSKALIRASRAWADVRRGEGFGIRFSGEAKEDFPAVMTRMRTLRAQLSRTDSAQRFTGLGVDVYLGQAQFTSAQTVQVGSATLDFAKAAICTHLSGRGRGRHLHRRAGLCSTHPRVTGSGLSDERNNLFADRVAGKAGHHRRGPHRL